MNVTSGAVLPPSVSLNLRVLRRAATDQKRESCFPQKNVARNERARRNLSFMRVKEELSPFMLNIENCVTFSRDSSEVKNDFKSAFQ